MPPAELDTSTFYKYGPFDILNTDGDGVVELVYSESAIPGGHATEHVLDVISPRNSGTLVEGDELESGAGTWAKRPGNGGELEDNEEWNFSLVRSHSGWRFTTAWHYYGDEKVSGATGFEPQVSPKPRISLGERWCQHGSGESVTVSSLGNGLA